MHNTSDRFYAIPQLEVAQEKVVIFLQGTDPGNKVLAPLETC